MKIQLIYSFTCNCFLVLDHVSHYCSLNASYALSIALFSFFLTTLDILGTLLSIFHLKN